MKNLKKVLALALAFALSLSLFAGAAQFTDAAEINVDYADSVNMLVELGIVGGYPDGSFGPAKNITRAEMTKLVYALKYGPDATEGAIFAGAASKFTDVEAKGATYWAKGFINYCATTGIIGGVGNNKFNPDGNVTVAEAAKMLLVALGADATKEGYAGSNWMGNVVSDAIDLGVFGEWKGDPSAAATREVIAYLMGNTLFSPIYVYSAVTGVGSQLDLYNNKNITLAEDVFDLKAYEGIVVATDNLSLGYDENGEKIVAAGYQPGTSNVDDAIKIVSGAAVYDVDGNTNAINVANEDECKILIEYVDDKGVLTKELITVGTDADDALLGNKVNVYIKTTNGRKLVVGDLIVDSDTVVYEVSAADIDIIPNGESKSTRNVLPYISIIAGDQEIKVKSRQSEVQAVAGNTDYVADLFADYFYFANANAVASNKAAAYGAYTDGRLMRPILADAANGTVTDQHDFIRELGTSTSATYRVISVDGGASVSYIIRTAEKALKKVGSISEAAGTIALGGAQVSLEDVVLLADVAKGDMVMAWYEGTTLYIDAVEEVTGIATVVDKETISVNDVEYKVDPAVLNGASNIANYFIANNNNNEGTVYTVYNDVVVKIDGQGISANIDEYAVVIDSSFDADEAVAKVRLAFADETTGVYTINRVNNKQLENGSQTTFLAPNDYINDAAVGAIFRYRLNSDGTVNLYTDLNVTNRPNGTAGINNYFFVDNGTDMPTDDEAIVYLLYGGLNDQNAPESQLSYKAVSAAVYKISDVDNNQTHTALQLYDPTLNNGQGGAKSTTRYGFVTNTGLVSNVVVAAYGIGLNKPTIIPKTGGFAYVLDAEYDYNYETNNYFANFTLIGQDGLIETTTIEEIDTDLNDTAAVGAVPKDGNNGNKAFARGSIANARISDGKIIAIQLLADIAQLQTTLAKNNGSYATGFYYANIASVGARTVTLYPYSANANDTDNASPAAISLNIVDNTNNFITFAIDGEEFVEDGEIETVTKGETIPAGAANAIIHVENNVITKIISLHNNY